jgi:hypothetical protein
MLQDNKKGLVMNTRGLRTWGRLHWVLGGVVVLLLGFAGFFLLTQHDTPDGRPEAPVIGEHLNDQLGNERKPGADLAPDEVSPSATQDAHPAPEPVPPGDAPAMSTLELLRAMRAAYEARDLALMNELRAAGMTRDDLSAPDARGFFQGLIRDKLEHHADEPVLEQAVADIVLRTWRLAEPDTLKEAWVGEVMAFAAALLRSNRFQEFDGGWRSGSRPSDDLNRQRREFVRPPRDMDTLAVAYLVDSALAHPPATVAYSEVVPLVSLFNTTKDYVEDRLSYAQIYTCQLLVRLNAVQHTDDLWRLFENAQMASVKGAALDAYVALGGPERIFTMAEQWAERAAVTSTDFALMRELELLARYGSDIETMWQLTQTFFTLLEASGVSWTMYSQAIVGGVNLRDQARDSNPEGIFDLLERDATAASVATWAHYIGNTFRETDNPRLLGWLQAQLYRFLADDSELRTDTERSRVVTHTVSAYIAVLSAPRKGQVFPLLHGGYEVALPSMMWCLDLRSRSLLAVPGLGGRLPEFGFTFEYGLELLVPASEREVPRLMAGVSTLNPRQGLEGFRGAWVNMQTSSAAAHLTRLAETAATEELREFYTETLIEWQKEADRRASGG